MRETELFEPLKNWFIDQEYDVYAEVSPHLMGKRADLVCKQGNIYTVVEMKKSLNLEVLEQAFDWRWRAHYVYIAIPRNKNCYNRFVRRLLTDAGIGLIIMDMKQDEGSVYCSKIYEVISPKLFRKITINWEKELLPEFKTNTGGSNDMEEIKSRYKVYMGKVKSFVLNSGGEVLLDEIADTIECYLANPRKSLYNCLRRFEEDWCEVYCKNKKLYVRAINNASCMKINHNINEGSLTYVECEPCN